MDSAGADADHPNLGARNASTKLVAGSHFIGIQFVRAAFNIDGDKFRLVLGLERRSYIVLVNGVATSGKFFFTVATFRGCHDYPSSTPSSLRALSISG